MAEKLPELSVFFPFWNEEKNIEKVVGSAVEVASRVASKWEIIIVDDGSKDSTLEKAKKLASSNPNIKIISHNPNRGYGAALKEGLINSKYEYVAFTDGDGQFDFNEIDKFIAEIKDADMVIGYKVKRNDPFGRLVLMNMLKAWDYMFFSLWFRDIDCGFKMFRKKALDEIMPLRSEGAMITTEILAKAIRKKLVIKEVPVNHYPRQFGEQSGANIPVVIRAVLESLILWWDIKNRRV
ncbi:MAG TPA: glycosyltransferase family 2 protein [Patescibacteria group bacterium]|nr:glycosyltransferase family 2 protein [Patescibacteria group bacterium]